MGVPAPLGVGASGKSPYANDQANAVLQGTLSVAGSSAIGATKPFAFQGPMNLFIWGEYNSTLTTTAGSLVPTVGAAGPIAAGQTIKGVNLPPGATVASIAGTDVTIRLPTYTLPGKVSTGVAKVRDLPLTTGLSGATVSGLGVAGGQTVTDIEQAAQQPNVNIAQPTKGIVTLSAVTTDMQVADQPTPYEFALAASGAITTGADAAAVFMGAAVGLTGVAQLERSFDGGQTWVVCNIGGSGGLAQWNMTAPVSISFGEPEKQILYRLNLISVTPATGISLKFRISETGQAATTLSVPTI